MNKKELSRLYEKNFEVLIKEAEKCSCWESTGKHTKCSNPKHQHAIDEERKLVKMCSKYDKYKAEEITPEKVEIKEVLDGKNQVVGISS